MKRSLLLLSPDGAAGAGPTPNETAFGFREVAVTRADGTPETIKVYQVAADLYPDILKHLDDERRLVELYCAREKGWGAELAKSPAAFDAVAQAGQDLNVDFFSRWALRQKARQEAGMTPAERAAKEKAIEALVARAGDALVKGQSAGQAPASPFK